MKSRRSLFLIPKGKEFEVKKQAHHFKGAEILCNILFVLLMVVGMALSPQGDQTYWYHDNKRNKFQGHL